VRALLNRLEIVSAYIWDVDDKRFGGFSGLLMEGDKLTAVTDRGTLLSSRWHNGSLTEASLSSLRDTSGKAIKKKSLADAESLARFGETGFLISFERRHRLLSYDGNVIQPFQAPPGLSNAPDNHGAEALTRLHDGRYFILQERLDDLKDKTVGWIGGPDEWQSFDYARKDGYRPTGATTLPNGSVLVLERYHSYLIGVRARVRKIDPSALKAGALIEGQLLGEIRAPLPVENFEAIATTLGKDGTVLIHLLADDNFSFLQDTIFLTLRVREP